MKPETHQNFAHVSMDISMSVQMHVKNVAYHVKLVLMILIIVLFVLKDMKTHQVVHGSTLHNPLKLKMFQSDQPRSQYVVNNVRPVVQTQMIVFLVAKIE